MRPKLVASFASGILSLTLLNACTIHRTVLNDLPKKALPGINNYNFNAPVHQALERGSIEARQLINEAKNIAAKKETIIWLVKSNQTDMVLVPVPRQSANSVNTAVKALLDGPTAEEARKGFGSEIPRGTILLDVIENEKRIEINLSRRFASGGGTRSIETRLQQLSKTVRPLAGDKPVFLNVESRRLSMTPGEGIEVKQPINM